MTARPSDVSVGTRKISVGYVIGSLDTGGAELQLLQLASRLDRRRFEPRIVCLSHIGSQAGAAQEAGIPVSCLGVGPVPQLKWGRWTWRLRRLFSATRLDVVQAVLFPSYALAAFAAAGLETRVVAGVRSVGLGREGRWPFSALDRAGLRRADRVVVNAEAVRTSLADRYPAVAAKALVIGNGVELGLCPTHGDCEGLRGEMGVPATAFLVLMVANLIGYKGHEDAIRAMALLGQRPPEIVLALAGAGPLESRLRSLVAELGLGRSVLFLGQRPDVPRLLAAADAALLASREEGLPNAVLEAMAAARPIVATAVGGVPELISHEATGLLVSHGDAEGIAQGLRRLASEVGLARRLGEAGRARVATNFTWERAVRRHEELYSSLCEQR